MLFQISTVWHIAIDTQYILLESTWETSQWTHFFVLYSSNLPSCDHNQWGVELCCFIRYQRLSLRLLAMCSRLDAPSAILSGRLCWSSAQRCKNAPPMTCINSALSQKRSWISVCKDLRAPAVFLSTIHTLVLADATQLDAQNKLYFLEPAQGLLGTDKGFVTATLRSPGTKEEVWHTFNTDTDTAFYWLITTAIFSSYGLQWSHEVWNAQATCFKHQPCRIGRQ